jgi:acyl-CoA synthetase (AMP-forming)/AMP-acid ligase II
MPFSEFRDEWSGLTLSAALERAAQRWGPDREAYVFGGTRLTFGQVQADAARVQQALKDAGVGPGDRVAVVMTGVAAWPGVYYGVSAAGAVVVPVNTRIPGREMAALVRRCGARAIVFHALRRDGVAERVDDALGELVHERPVDLGSDGPALAGMRIATFPPVPGDRRDVGDDDAVIIFTSGSSGVPKAAVLHHEGILRGGHNVNQGLDVGPDDVFFSPQPFFHAGGAIQVINAPVTTGCTVVVQETFDVDGSLQAIADHACTITLGHQPHWVDYLAHPQVHELTGSLRGAFVIGETPIRERIEDELGIVTVSPYGMTETHVAGTCSHAGDDRTLRTEAHGRAYPGVDLQIVEPATGQRLAAGEVGEICIGGWAVSRGYLDEDGSVSPSVDDHGLMRTGDLGRLDPDGTLFRLGRIKDIIRVGGENVGATEIERVLSASEHVRQVRVTAWPDERMGEVPVAVVAVDDAAAAGDDIRRLCSAGLARFQVPRIFVFTRQLPMGATGKIESAGIRALVERGFDDPERTVVGEIAVGSSSVPMLVSTAAMGQGSPGPGRPPAALVSPSGQTS